MFQQSKSYITNSGKETQEVTFNESQDGFHM